jgi:hypothetical protein
MFFANYNASKFAFLVDKRTPEAASRIALDQSANTGPPDSKIHNWPGPLYHSPELHWTEAEALGEVVAYLLSVSYPTACKAEYRREAVETPPDTG